MHNGGAHFTLDKPHLTVKSKGTKKIKCYIDATARVSKNYGDGFEIDASRFKMPATVKIMKTKLTTIKTMSDRLNHHISEVGCKYRIEIEQYYSWLEDDLNKHLKTESRREDVYAFLENTYKEIRHNNLLEIQTCTEDECPTLKDIASNVYQQLGRLHRECTFRENTKMTEVFADSKKAWLDATLAHALCSGGLSSTNLYKWIQKYNKDSNAYDPDCLKEAREEDTSYVDNWGNLTDKGYTWLLLKFVNTLCSEEVCAEVEELHANDNRNEEEEDRLMEIWNHCNDNMERLTRALTNI